MPDYQNAPQSHWTIAGGPLDNTPFISGVSGYSSTTPVESISYQDEQGNPVKQTWFSRQTPTGQITVTRYLDDNTNFSDARNQVLNGEFEPTTITLTLMTADAQTLKTIAMHEAWPSEHTITEPNSDNQNQFQESLTIAFNTSEVS
jgi:T4-like virus tail tube protein gp19